MCRFGLIPQNDSMLYRAVFFFYDIIVQFVTTNNYLFLLFPFGIPKLVYRLFKKNPIVTRNIHNIWFL